MIYSQNLLYLRLLIDQIFHLLTFLSRVDVKIVDGHNYRIYTHDVHMK